MSTISQHNKPSWTTPVVAGVALCFLLVGTVSLIVLFTIWGYARTQSQNQGNDIVLVERSLRQFKDAQIAAARYRETHDPMFAKQASEHIKKANEILSGISDFWLFTEVGAKLVTGVYHHFDHNFRFAVQVREAERENEAYRQKEGWEGVFISLDHLVSLLNETGQLSQEHDDLAEIRQIREETLRLVFRDGDLDASNGELADEFFRVLQQRCQQSIDWLEKLRDRSETEEMKGAITESINRHKVLLGTSKTLAGCYSVPRRTWAELDTIAAQADAIGDELRKSGR